MSRLVLATASTDLEQRVRDAFDGELRGPLRYWRDDMLATPRRGPGARRAWRRGRRTRARRPQAEALALASVLDHDRPDISVLTYRRRRPSSCNQRARAARGTSSPDMAPADLRTAIERAFDTATHRRRVFDSDENGYDEGDRSRVIMALCPKGGAGKTTVSTNLALALGQVAPGEVVILDLDLQFGDVASALGLRPDLTFADAVRSLDSVDATSLKAHLTVHPRAFSGNPAMTRRARQVLINYIVNGTPNEDTPGSFKYVVIDTASGLDENTLASPSTPLTSS
jgi:pilus assembly protein CpaE